MPRCFRCRSCRRVRRRITSARSLRGSMTITRAAASRLGCGWAVAQPSSSWRGPWVRASSGRLIGGRDPLTSAVLRASPRKRITVERIDPATGERRLEEKALSPVAGYDLVFSPPKSVSLLHALGWVAEVRHRRRYSAHLAAWQAALGYLEQEACVTRRGKKQIVRERGCAGSSRLRINIAPRRTTPHLSPHVMVAGPGRPGATREIAGARRRTDLEALPARGGFLLPGPAAVRADPLARGRSGGSRIAGWRRSSASRMGRFRRSRSDGRSCSTTSNAAAARASTLPRSPRSRLATARSRSTCRACAWSGRRARPSAASAAESSSGCSTARSCASSTLPRSQAATSLGRMV